MVYTPKLYGFVPVERGGGGFDNISVVSTDIDMDKTPGLHQVFKTHQ